MNFFAWIRDGVRQAVLLGVSDAVEHIGTPPEGEDIRQRLGEVLRADPAAPYQRLPGNTQRKKLGRTLEEIQATAKPST